MVMIYISKKKNNLTVYDSTRTIKQFSLVNIFGRIKQTQNMKKKNTKNFIRILNFFKIPITSTAR